MDNRSMLNNFKNSGWSKKLGTATIYECSRIDGYVYGTTGSFTCSQNRQDTNVTVGESVVTTLLTEKRFAR